MQRPTTRTYFVSPRKHAKRQTVTSVSCCDISTNLKISPPRSQKWSYKICIWTHCSHIPYTQEVKDLPSKPRHTMPQRLTHPAFAACILCAFLLLGNTRAFLVHPRSDSISISSSCCSFSEKRSHRRRTPCSRSGGSHRSDVIARHNPSRSIFSLYLSSSNSNNQQAEEENSDSSTNSVEDELNRLQNILNSIEALESRNEAQLESFVDKEDQWNSMDDAERELLESKQKTLDLLEKMTEELLQMWIGAKSMEG
jgi:hypothetical protein